MAGPADTQVAHEFLSFLPLIRVYKSGRVHRLGGGDVVPAGDDPLTGVSSKDVVISPNVSARLFLPKHALLGKRRPVLVYFHGGGFVIESPFSPLYHQHVASLAASVGAVAVSVHYRLAPEHPLPAAHEDSWAALRWVAAHVGVDGPEEWLARYGDFGQIIIAGDSAGGNIVHHMAIRAGEEHALPTGSRVAAAAMVHPYFWGPPKETPGPVVSDAAAEMEEFWRFLCPTTSGLDDPAVNPAGAGPAAAKMGSLRVLVCVAEEDFLRDWGRAYYEWLRSSRFEGSVEMIESQGVGHVFHLFHPDSNNAQDLLQKLTDFMSQTA